MKKILRIGIILLVVAALGGAGYYLVRRKQRMLEKVPEYTLEPRPVTISTAREGTLTEERHYLAVVEAGQQADVAPRVTAPVTNIRVDEGDRVKAGDTLVKLDAEEVRHSLDSLESKIKQAGAERAAQEATIASLESSAEYWNRERKRDRRLAEKDAIPGSQAEKTADRATEVKAKLQAARDNLRAVRHRIASLRKQKKELQTKLDYYTLESPTNGVVARRMVDPGDMASRGKPVLQVETRDAMRLVFDVPQEDLPEVKEDRPVRYSAGGRERKTPLTLMYPSLNEARMMRAEAWISSNEKKAGLTPGAYVSVSVVLERTEGATLVPRSSIIDSPDDSAHVFAVVDGRLEGRKVEVLGYTDDRAAVSGVDPGIEVVRNTYLGWARLAPGQKVEAMQ
ncbi:MAG: efflux RND transporter periplasmic adaptor subunit [Planctomycetota bacterium]